MPFSEDRYNSTFGRAWHSNGAAVGRLLHYVTYAGSPSGNVTPEYIGQQCFDTANEDFYIATGTGNTDWKQITA